MPRILGLKRKKPGYGFRAESQKASVTHPNKEQKNLKVKKYQSCLRAALTNIIDWVA